MEDSERKQRLLPRFGKSNLQNYIKESKKTAKQLGYGPEVIEKIEKASTISSVDTILHEARLNDLDVGRRKKKKKLRVKGMKNECKSN